MSVAHRLIQLLFVASIAAASTAMAAPPPAAPSKTLEMVRKRGTIHIGIKTDFAPFGHLDAKGDPQGLEVDLAHDIARQLGVRPVLRSVTTENRFRVLEQGDIDIIIATVADTQARRQIATAIEPHYYSGGVNVFLRPDQHITDWAGLRGQTLCATQSSYFNRPASQRYLLELAVYRDTRDALLALREGRCIGYLYSGPAIQAYLKKPEWSGYTAPLPEVMGAPWAIQISREEAGSEMARLLGDIVAQWHRSGFLIERERAWGIQPTRFLVDEQVRWSRRQSDGTLACARDERGEWPVDCRNLAFVRADEADGLLALGLWIRDKTDVNLTPLYNAYDRSIFLNGIWHTLILMTGAVLGSLGLGIGAALLIETRRRFLGVLVRAITLYGRTTPPLLMMYLVLFGIGALLSAHLGWHLSPLAVAIGCMSFYSGSAIMAQLLGAAEHLREENPAFRLTRRNVTHLADLTAASLKSILVNVLKQSVMASAIAVPELLSASIAIMSDQGNVNVMMNAFLFTLILLIMVWGRIFDGIERLVRRRANACHE